MRANQHYKETVPVTTTAICIYDRATLWNGFFGEVQMMVMGEDGTLIGFSWDEFKRRATPFMMADLDCVFTEDHRIILLKSHLICASTPTKSNRELPFVCIGDRVYLKNRQQHGILQFVGEVHRGEGCRYGVALEEPLGDHDGSVNGVRFFMCGDNYGVFCESKDLLPEQQPLPPTRALPAVPQPPMAKPMIPLQCDAEAEDEKTMEPQPPFPHSPPPREANELAAAAAVLQLPTGWTVRHHNGRPYYTHDQLSKATWRHPSIKSERDFYETYWIEQDTIGEFKSRNCKVRRLKRKSACEGVAKKMFVLRVAKKNALTKEDVAALQRELEIIQKCNHSNVLQLCDVYASRKRIYMVMENFDGGHVLDRMQQERKWSERSVVHVVHQVASALAHVHSLGFMHGNLQSENILYVTKEDNSDIKIIGFGADCSGKGPVRKTTLYTAPEVLLSSEYDPSADMWSLGVIIYTLLSGCPPFADRIHGSGFRSAILIVEGKYSFPSPFWDQISEHAKDLISKLLIIEPSQRLTAEQVLAHEWIVNGATAPDKDLAIKYFKHRLSEKVTQRESELMAQPVLSSALLERHNQCAEEEADAAESSGHVSHKRTKSLQTTLFYAEESDDSDMGKPFVNID